MHFDLSNSNVTSSFTGLKCRFSRCGVRCQR